MTKRHIISENMEELLVAIFKPIVDTLNGPENPITDTGQEKRGDNDRALLSRFNFILTALLRSAKGVPDDQQSQQYSSLEFMNQAEHRLAELMRRYQEAGDADGFMTDPNAERLYFYRELNQMRYDADMQLLDAFQGAYQRLFNKKWTYVPKERSKPSTASQSPANSKLAEFWEQEKLKMAEHKDAMEAGTKSRATTKRTAA